MKQLESLENKIHSARDKNKSFNKDEVFHLDIQTKILEKILTGSDSLPYFSEVYVYLKEISSRGDSLDALLSLAGMYQKLSEKFHLRYEVIADQVIKGPDENSLVIKISGIGTTLLLQHESALHEVIRRYPNEEGREKDRELIEVEVLPVWEQFDELNDDDLQIDIQPLDSVSGRLIANPQWDVRMMHGETFISIHVHTDGERSTIKERLLPLLQARVANCENRPAGEKQIIRTYELGLSGVVKDHRTHLRTGRVDRIFQGNLEKFLILAEGSVAVDSV